MQENKNFKYIPVTEVGIYKTIIPNLDLDFWVKKCYDLKSSFPSTQKSNKGGWQSEDIAEEPQLFDLIKLINSILFNFAKNPNIRIKEMWANISSFGHFNTVHSHNPYFFKREIISGVLYLKNPPKSGDIIFYDTNDFNHQTRITPIEKTLLLFSSYTYHSVEPNLSQEDRISIAFNCNQ